MKVYIREWAEYRGLTIPSLGRRADISTHAMTRAAAGQGVRTATLEAIAGVLGVTVGDLFQPPPES